MAKAMFETFERYQVTEHMFEEAVDLFNKHYGIWGKDPTRTQWVPTQGTRVKLSRDRLRAQCLPENVDCSYAKVTIDNCLAGNAFACRWRVNGLTACWVTQLVVHKDYRKRGLAVDLLSALRRDEDGVYGILSSHPAACLAAAKAFGSDISHVSPNFIRENASSFMGLSPVDYVRDAVLRGSLFESHDTSGVVSSVCTNFFVDHTEPLEALLSVRQRHDWQLGELLDGHEFLLMIERGPWGRSGSRSSC